MPGEISGVTLIDGEPAELIDAHWLFAESSRRGRAAGRRSWSAACPSDDPWMQNMLRPIVEAAGYRVVGESDELDRRPGHRVRKAARSPRAGRPHPFACATDPEAADGEDSIYRYDRAGLLMALKSASAGRG